MKKTMLVVALSCICSVAFAAEPAKTDVKTDATKMDASKDAMKAQMPMPPKAGAETKVLKPVMVNASWTGKMLKDAMGPGSPEMATKGKQTCKWVANDLWVACDYEETMGTGKQAMTWKGHYVMGWDFQEKTYKAVGADSMGKTGSMTGTVDGSKLVMTADKPEEHMGHQMLSRLIWDWSDAKTIKFTMEASMDNGETWKQTSEASYKKGAAGAGS